MAVHFNNQAEVERFVDHVLSLLVPEGWRTVVAIADNSRNWHPRSVSPASLLVTVPERNLGYLNGCAHALSEWMGSQRVTPDWVAVTNTDVKFADDAFVRLLQNDWSDATGAIAPRIATRHHRDQNPFMRTRPPRLRLRLLLTAFSNGFWRGPLIWILGSPLYTSWSRIKDRMRSSRDGPRVQESASEESGPIYAPHGSVVFLSRAFFGAGCNLTMPWMMFGEELHLAEQMRRAGLSVLWVPSIRVEHQMASATGTARREQLMDWRAESLKHILDLYFSDRPSQSSQGPP